jgi:hypothetical protein
LLAALWSGWLNREGIEFGRKVPTLQPAATE